MNCVLANSAFPYCYYITINSLYGFTNYLLENRSFSYYSCLGNSINNSFKHKNNPLMFSCFEIPLFNLFYRISKRKYHKIQCFWVFSCYSCLGNSINNSFKHKNNSLSFSCFDIPLLNPFYRISKRNTKKRSKSPVFRDFFYIFFLDAYFVQDVFTFSYKVIIFQDNTFFIFVF